MPRPVYSVPTDLLMPWEGGASEPHIPDPKLPERPVVPTRDPGLRDRLLGCHACELRAGCKSPVPWSGPHNAQIIFFGEAPGEREDTSLVPFTGQAGREFDNYLFRIFLERADVRVSNTVRCRPQGNADPTPEQTAACRPWTIAEIDQCQPQVIVAMGRHAIRSFVGDVSVEETHGRVFDYWHEPADGSPGRTIPVFCITHPAAGLHNTRDMQTILNDFGRLSDFLTGEYTAKVDEFAGKEDYRVAEGEELERLIRLIEWGKAVHGEKFTISADTEWTPDEKIWCATFSMEPGVAWLVWPKDLPTLAPYLAGVRITLHQAQADITPLQEGGIPVDPNRLGDTMIGAWLLGMRQGLKYLCRTLHGMEMLDYLEVVSPEQRRIEREYFERALEVEIPPKVKGDRRSTIHGLIKRALQDMDKEESGVGKPVTPRKRWAEWDEERKSPILAALGDFPIASLADVEFSKALWYACRDADGTERSRRTIEKMLADFKPWAAA